MNDLKLYSRHKRGLDLLVLTIHVFSGDIRMDFGTEK